MNKSDSNKVLTHIDEAKNWLDEAKEEYTQSNRVGGELNLNLAQAEVKYAWELSRRQNVTPIDQAVPAGRVIKYFPAAAAVLFIVLGLTGGLYWVKQNVKIETPDLTAKNKNMLIKKTNHTPTVNQTTPVAKVTVGTVAENSSGISTVDRSKQTKIAPIGAPEVIRVKSIPKIVNTEGAKDAKNLETTDKNKPSVVSGVTEKMEKSQVADNTTKIGLPENQITANVAQTERDIASNVPKLSVASLVIDEEALTKEASYSLRNGK
jgi:hypothetical protein